MARVVAVVSDLMLASRVTTALAGAGHPLDREATARDLGFAGVAANSMDAVSDRDFVVEILGADAYVNGNLG